MEISVVLDVGEFNQGARASQKFISSLGFSEEKERDQEVGAGQRGRKAEAVGRWRAVCCRCFLSPLQFAGCCL